MAQTWADNNIGPDSKQTLSTYTTIARNGIETVGNYFNSFSVEDIQANLANTIQAEAIKDQKVEILTSWKTNIFTDLDYIQTNLGTLKNNFSYAKSIYLATPRIQDKTSILQAQKIAINGKEMCSNTNTTTYCGCTDKYKQLCDALDTIIQSSTNERTGINDNIDTIQNYSVTANGQTIQKSPIADTSTAIINRQQSTDIADTKTTINGFATTDNAEEKEIIKGINITTPDRPIDNIRNITFKGIGGDTVRLNYPNLYEVPVYKQEAGILKLKTPEEIRDSIKTYMTQKINEYNTQLQTQADKKNTYYQSFAAQFNFLQTIDPLASPNRSYTLLPQDFFITHLTDSLDRMKTLYGKQYIFGETPSTTTDDKLLLIAKLLRYQNSPRQERQPTTSPQDDIQANKNAFNVNQKISDTMQQYLQEGINQGAFLTPSYNQSGYEVAFINSDGNDLIQTETTPAFIQQLQNAKQQQADKATQANKLIQNTQQTSQESEIQNEC